MEISRKSWMANCLFRLGVLVIFGNVMAADSTTTYWNWHQQFPWVYSDMDKDWHYWRAGSDGNFYRWKNSDKTWYQFDQSAGKWIEVTTVSSTQSSTNLSGEISDKSEFENWWDYYYNSDGSSKEQSVEISDDILSLSLEHDGLTREYLLYVPSSYNSSTAVPLLFNFHGYGGTSSAHLSSTDMRSLSDQENFLLCYPQGSSDSYGSSHWNAALPGGDNKSTADDIGFVSALIASISSSYLVDSTRIYACGYSNGGMMSYFLGGSMSEKIAAIGSVSGSMLEGNPEPANPVPMINLHGTADYVLTYSGGDGSISTTDTLSYWATRNGASTTPVITNINSGNLSLQKSVYLDSNGTTWVEHYKMIDGGHVWFELDLSGSDTNQLLWDFFKKHDLNGPR